jgi:hypothetical protein
VKSVFAKSAFLLERWSQSQLNIQPAEQANRISNRASQPKPTEYPTEQANRNQTMDRTPSRSATLACVAAVLLTMIITLSMSFHVVPFDSVGLRYSKSSKEVDPIPNPPGRYFLGLNERFHLFKTTLLTIDYSTASGCESKKGCTLYEPLLLVPQGNPNKVAVRMSMQYTLHNPYHIYTNYKFNSVQHFERNLRQKLKHVALKYKMHQFFDDRAAIETNFRVSCAETLAGMGAQLKLLHVETLTIPAAQDTALQNIVLQSYQMTVGVEQGNLDKAGAWKQQALLEYSSSVEMDQNKIQTHASLDLAKIRANHTQLNVSITREVDAIKMEEQMKLYSWTKETENLLTKVWVNKSTADEATLLAMALVRAAAMGELAVYEQQTSNLRLAVQANLTKITEVTKQQTAAIRAGSLAKLTAYKQETDMMSVALERQQAHVAAQTAMELARIEQEILAIKSAQQSRVSRIEADAAAVRSRSLQQATNEAKLGVDALEKEALADLTDSMQLNGTDVNLLKFLESFGGMAGKGQRVFMDIKTPAMFSAKAGLYGGDV